MKTASLALLAALPFLACADELAERRAEAALNRILDEEQTWTVYYSIGDSGRVTLLFGGQTPVWKVEAVVRRIHATPEITALTHAVTDTEFCPINAQPW
jgi:hypothetical protein